MRKLALVLLVTLPLGACDPATTFANLKNGFVAASAGINNPVTPTMLYEVENGATIIFAGLQAYKRTCVAGTIAPVCKSNIKKIQVYTRKLPPLLTGLRGFVKNNDQVNAVIAYNTVLGIIADLKGTATANGVSLGGN